MLRDWTPQRHKTVTRTKTIYFTLKDEGFKISVQDERIECPRTPQLSDTKMFLAANFASNSGVESVTIHTVDSDMAILACYYAPLIESCIIIKIGSGKYERMLNVTESSLDQNLIRSLPGLHAFSGCDSTSAFHGIGKIKWLNLVKKNMKSFVMLYAYLVKALI